MMGSKKFYVPPALLALALLGSGTALGQICTVSASGAQVRAEGITEKVSDIRLQCFSGSSSALDGYKVTVDVHDGVQITNTIESNDDKMAKNVTLTFTDPDDKETAIEGKIISNSSVEFSLARPSFAQGETLKGVISGIRVNAATAGAGNVITATVTDNDAGFLRTDVPLARPAVGLKTKREGDPVEGVACANSKGIGSGDLDDNEDGVITKIRVEEGFAAAFTTSTASKTRLLLSFEDIPAGVKVWLRPGDTTRDNELACNDDTLKLHLLTGIDSNGFGEGSVAEPADDDDNFVEVSISNGSGSAVYEVAAESPTKTEKCDIPVTLTWKSADVSLGTGKMSASFARTSTVNTANVEDSLVPRFVKTGDSVEALTIEDCSTTLLFPFVINHAGYETGIAISNTSQDAFGTSEQSGSCTIHYHGSTADGGEAPSAETSEVVGAGEQLIFLLSSKASGFQGYLMARCEFQFAHGFAFITNNFGGMPSLAQGYLALVVPVQHGDRGVSAGAHEELGQ